MRTGPEQLQDWAERRDFNYTEAAEYLGIDKSVMTKLANGTRRAGLKIAHMIERKTGIPAEAWLPEYEDTVSGAVGVITRKRKSDK